MKMNKNGRLYRLVLDFGKEKAKTAGEVIVKIFIFSSRVLVTRCLNLEI